MFSVDPQQIPSQVRELLQQLASKNPKEIERKFIQVKEHFRYDLITLGDAKACYNSENLYQIEWWLLGKQAQILGTLIFGRKLSTTYGQAPLRKFWIRRRRNANFGELTPAALINCELYDPLYFHDHDEAIRLNQYSQCGGDIVYRHESAEGKNPNWHCVSPVPLRRLVTHTKERRKPLFGSDRGIISISDNFDDPIDDFEG